MAPLTILNVAYPLAPVGPDAVGGAEQVLSTLDRALVDAGHRSLVIACEGSRTAGTLCAIPAERGTLDDAARQRAWAATRQAIAAALARWPLDLVHLHGVDFLEYLPEIAPTLVTLHLPLAWYPAATLRRRRAGLWLHCVSEAQHRTAPQGADLLAPIANGVDIEALDHRHARRGFALMLGRICPEKGVHIALAAAHRAELPLLIGGRVFPYVAHERYFEEQVRPRLDAKRRFLGPLDVARKRRFLSAARCVLIPSLVPETSSLVAAEALACGTPVVAYPAGALADIVEHGRTGYVVADEREMAEAIDAAATLNPEHCRAAARDRFALGRMVGAYLARYRELARAPLAKAG